jgi:EAL domain-containing protein (putative c-di-GMP-specific phosphodiesterase class I)
MSPRTTKPPPTMTPIRRAIDDRAMKIVYQPIVDLRTRQVFAYEALARPQTPDFKGPLELFAAAVDDKCTGELGRLLREMSIAGCPDAPLFINIHPSELNEHYLVQTNDPLFCHNEDIYLEITEGVPLSHFELCQTILREVRGRGVHLVVDDLGAGYSNLKYIADLHPRVVKLDRELIAGLVVDSRLFKLVAGIVVMCRELDAMVVAEGIETIEELAAVQESGARFGQGYLLARPAFPLPKVTWPESMRIVEPRTTTRPKVRAQTQPGRTRDASATIPNPPSATPPGAPSRPTPVPGAPSRPTPVPPSAAPNRPTPVPPSAAPNRPTPVPASAAPNRPTPVPASAAPGAAPSPTKKPPSSR